MSPPDPLAPLPARDGDPVFEEAWQAEALALADCLVRRGAFTASDWASALGAAIAARADEPDTTETYYRAVVAALETLLDAQGTIPTAQQDARREDWRRAYLETPHGEPVTLE